LENGWPTGASGNRPFVAEGFSLIFFFSFSTFCGIGYGFDSLGERIHSLVHQLLPQTFWVTSIFA
jgi:hypothetical protein